MLHKYRRLYSLHKNRRYLCTHCKRCSKKFDISIYELDRPLPKEKNKNVILLMKDEL